MKKLMKSIHDIRSFEQQFFKNNIFVDENDPDVNIMERGSGPGPGRNLVEKVNLDFIEKNDKLQKILSDILGSDYKIMTKKFVMGIPQNMIPDWILEKTKGVGSVNLCAYVKPEYRDMTYFHGIDFHQDLKEFLFFLQLVHLDFPKIVLYLLLQMIYLPLIHQQTKQLFYHLV